MLARRAAVRRSRSRICSGSVGAGLLPRWPRIMLRFASNRVTGGSLAFCGFLDGFFGFSRPPTPLLDFFGVHVPVCALFLRGFSSRAHFGENVW